MGYEYAWLNYRLNKNFADSAYFASVSAESGGRAARTAVKELQRAAKEILGLEMQECSSAEKAGVFLKADKCSAAGAEGYHIWEKDGRITIESAGDRGLLYGTFALIRRIQTGKPLKGVELTEIPQNPLRMLNHWDNMDGSIERGYSGNSFFFKGEEILVNERTREYARLAASVGINASVINNVNVKGNATKLITESCRGRLCQLAEIFADYGITLYLSLNFAAPMEIGGLNSADPLDGEVRKWWSERMRELFCSIPNLGGFLVKADSEGRPGPFTYGRTHADGANMLADAAAPYGGTIIWRCFVYNCQQDWRDRKTDRARSGYDNFMPLDGSFRENVILQIKNGPMDFQVREPVSPLLGGLRATNQMLEVQIAQEYTGQQRHVCYLIPMFKEVLEFKTFCKEEADTVADLVSGRAFGQSRCGMAAVANTGDDENWTGHDLAAANLFGFGRLAFCTELTAEEIAREWIQCTFGNCQEVVEGICKILMGSWKTYEKYTSPLGIGWMVNPGFHYGPNVDGYEYDRWGTYHRADHFGIGVDRSDRGTGYALQYHQPNAGRFNELASCPEELLLFFHHVPYTYVLKSGKTLIQHIYDSHFEGAKEAEEMMEQWKALKPYLPEAVYHRTLERFEHQKAHAGEWRDQINSYFFRKSAIEDCHHRAIY